MPSKPLSLTAAQIRAARGLLNWSQTEFAEKAGLSIGTIRTLESGNISPRGRTNRAIFEACERAGLEFIEPNGVRQRRSDVRVFVGLEQIIQFYDAAYDAARRGSDSVIVHPSAKRYFSDLLGNFAHEHVERMKQLKSGGIVKCIITKDRQHLPASIYCAYRYLSKSYVNAAPSYVYDDKYALFILDPHQEPKIIVIRSWELADAMRQQFYSMWEKAAPLN